MLTDVGAGSDPARRAAYDADAMRQTLAERSAWACVKPMPTRTNVPAFSPFLYRFRNTVERYFNKLKHFRAVATRYEKHDENFLALVKPGFNPHLAAKL